MNSVRQIKARSHRAASGRTSCFEQLALDMPPADSARRSVRAGTKPNLDPVREMDRLLSATQVVHVIGRHRTTIYRWVLAGVFPCPVKVSSRIVGWRKSDIEQWMALKDK